MNNDLITFVPEEYLERASIDLSGPDQAAWRVPVAFGPIAVQDNFNHRPYYVT